VVLETILRENKIGFPKETSTSRNNDDSNSNIDMVKYDGQETYNITKENLSYSNLQAEE